MAQGQATVQNVLSGDTVVLCGNNPSGGPPPIKQISLAAISAPKLAMKSPVTETKDEPGAFAAREFLREALIGKVVSFKIEYAKNDREYGVLKFENKTVGVDLLKAGLAKVVATQETKKLSVFEELSAAEEEAKAKNLGVHGGGGEVRKMLYSTDTDFDTAAFVKENQTKKFDATVEFVRDAGAFKVLLHPNNAGGDYMLVQMALAGVQCPRFDRKEGKEVPQPYAAEAKHFVSQRLLGRKLTVRIECKDDFGNIYGSLLHPKGNIALLLCENGFAKVADWSANSTELGSKPLRDAMKNAQGQKLRIWKDWAGSIASHTGEFTGVVVEVCSGDVVFIKNVETNEEKRYYMASIRAPKMGTRDRKDEPYAFEAREFIRKRTIGKRVRVNMEYSKDTSVFAASGNTPPPASDASGHMIFATIYLNDKTNLAEALCKQGLVQTIRHRVDDERSKHYDDLLAAEADARENKIGTYSDAPAKEQRYNDLMGDKAKSKQFENSLKRNGEMDGVIEFVANAARFKVRLPSEHLYIALNLAGVRAPATARGASAGEPFGDEALSFARESVMQQSVRLSVDMCDRGGNFIGQLWMLKDNKKVPYAEALLAKGLGWCDEYSNTGSYGAAQAKAQKEKLGIWSVEDTSSKADEAAVMKQGAKIGPCEVVHINGIEDFFVQDKSNPMLRTLEQTLAGLDNPRTMTSVEAPRRGEVVLAQFDGGWYRAKIEGRGGAPRTHKVNFIDFGNVDDVGDVKQLPASLATTKIPAQALRCSLNCLKASEDYWKDAAGCLQHLSSTVGPKYWVLFESTFAGKSKVLMATKEDFADEKTKTVNEEILAYGLARVDKRSTSAKKKKMETAMEKARKDHLAMWQYGDAYESDEDRYDGPKVGRF